MVATDLSLAELVGGRNDDALGVYNPCPTTYAEEEGAIPMDFIWAAC